MAERAVSIETAGRGFPPRLLTIAAELRYSRKSSARDQSGHRSVGGSAGLPDLPARMPFGAGRRTDADAS